MSASQQSLRLAEYSLAVRRSTLKRLALVPPGLENWSPIPGRMSFADTAAHLIDADTWLMAKYRDRALVPIHGRAGLLHIADRHEYSTLLTDLEHSGQLRCDFVRILTEDDLADELFDGRYDKMITVWWLIVRGNLDHETHHRGQMAAYLRLAQG